MSFRRFPRLILPFCVVLLFGACASTPSAPPLPEELVLDTPMEGWELARASRGLDVGDWREWVPAGQSLQNWTRLISRQLIYTGPVNAAAYARQNAEQLTRYCDSLAFELLEYDERSALYELSSVGCASLPNYTEIARLVLGDVGLHRAAYAVSGRDLTDEERENWLGWLRAAEVVARE